MLLAAEIDTPVAPGDIDISTHSTMAKWLTTTTPPANGVAACAVSTHIATGSAVPAAVVSAGRPTLVRVRSGSLTALDQAPPALRKPPAVADSPPAPVALRRSSNNKGYSNCSTSDTSSSAIDAKEDDPSALAMRAAAMAIPQFRSCRVTKKVPSNSDDYSSRATNYSNNNQDSEWRIRRRGRSVSDNSSCSTVSLNSSTSSARFSLRQLSADVSAFRSGSMDSDDSMDGGYSLVDSTVVAPALPRPPYPVDPYHFYCVAHLSAGAVITDIAAALNDCDVEHSLHAYKCKFKCVKYVHYSHVEFIVRVYAHRRALLVECQRRSGSLLLWDGLYNTLYHKLADIVDPAAAACPQSGGQKRVGAMRRDSLSAQIWRAISVQTPSSGVEAMKIMLTSKYTDAQREGCAGLAVLTEDPQSAYLVAKHDLVGALVRAADADDLDMARCAVGALANIANALSSFPNADIASETEHHIALAATTVTELLTKTSDTQFALELLRECARALRAFSRVCPQQLAASESKTQLVRLAHHRDAQLAAHCCSALEALHLI